MYLLLFYSVEKYYNNTTKKSMIGIAIIKRKLSREQGWLYCTQTVKTKGAFLGLYSTITVDGMVCLHVFWAELFHFWIALDSRMNGINSLL